MSRTPRIRAWRFSSAIPGSAFANTSASASSKAATIGSIGISRNWVPRLLCNPPRILASLVRRVPRGHGDEMHSLGPEHLRRERSRDRGVDSARDAKDDLAEPVLRHVVGEAELERAAHLLELAEEGLEPRLWAACRPTAPPSPRPRAGLGGSSAHGQGLCDARREAGGRWQSRDRCPRSATPPRTRARARRPRPPDRPRTSGRRRRARPARRRRSRTRPSTCCPGHGRTASARAPAPSRGETERRRCSRGRARPRG